MSFSCCLRVPSLLGHHTPYSVGPPMWQGQAPDASPQPALPGVLFTGAKPLCFNTLSYLGEVVLDFPSHCQLTYCRRPHFGGRDWMDLEKLRIQMPAISHKKSSLHSPRLYTVYLPNDSHCRSLTSAVTLYTLLNLSVPKFPSLIK